MIDDTANDESSKKPACGPYKRSFTESPQDFVNKVSAEIKKNGGSFNGSTSNGSFKVKGIKGDYTISGQEVTIIITDQGLYPCDVIHAYIKSHIH